MGKQEDFNGNKRKCRRYINFYKIFPNFNTLTKTEQKRLKKLYGSYKTSNVKIHNLSNAKITIPVDLALTLGLKFNFKRKPNTTHIINGILEGTRKIAWKVFFHGRQEKEEKDEELTSIIIKIRKAINSPKLTCPIENVLFERSVIESSARLLIRKKASKQDRVHEYLIKLLEDFIKQNDIIIKQSDKNAGLVVMNLCDYNTEILRQLHDLETYIPSTTTHFNMEMEKFVDLAKYNNKVIFKNFKLNFKQLIPKNYSPAKFYILPKIHKKYTVFPVGRPICSNVNTINRGVSILLDSILRPLTICIPTLLIDTPHVLFLLNNLKLNPSRKYCLVTADIQSMYQELPISVCKNNCVAYFNLHKDNVKIPLKITESQLKIMLNMCLDYSFIKFEKEIFFQKRGIQMGSNCSVSVANLTAAVELQNLWKPEMVFKGRFIDDLLCIVDVTDVNVEIEEWLVNTFQHRFLKFTYEYSFESINFLDLKISINEKNEIVTSLFTKEVSKHEYLHFSSDHPVHMKRSLPYSCGLRVIRTCSNLSDRIAKLNEMFVKFQRRGYPEDLLIQTKDTLLNIDRDTQITLSSPFHKKHFEMHCCSLPLVRSIQNKEDNFSSVFIILPHYSFPIRDIVQKILMSCISKCISVRLKSIASQINLKYAFTIPNQSSKVIAAIERKK